MKANIQGAALTAPDKAATGHKEATAMSASRKVRLLQGTALLLTALIMGSGIQRYRAAAVARHDSGTCYGHMKEISAALMKYRSEHNGRVPRVLVPSPPITEADTLYPRYIKSMDVLVCPTAAKYRAQQGNTLRPDQPSYEYHVQYWLRDRPRDLFTSKEFYSEIVPERGNRIRLVECGAHPGGANDWVIMWDGSIEEQSHLYDASFGRGSRDPAIRAWEEKVRKRGGILPPAD